MKATLKFLKDFYSPPHKKTFIAADPKKNSIEIDVDEIGQPLHSFWFTQLKDSPDYFELSPIAASNIITDNKSKKK